MTFSFNTKMKNRKCQISVKLTYVLLTLSNFAKKKTYFSFVREKLNSNNKRYIKQTNKIKKDKYFLGNNQLRPKTKPTAKS